MPLRTLSNRLWFLTNPMQITITLTLDKDGSVVAELYALAGATGKGGTIDAAVLDLAKNIVEIMENRKTEQS